MYQMMKTWSVINSVIGRSNDKTTIPDKFKVSDELLNDIFQKIETHFRNS